MKHEEKGLASTEDIYGTSTATASRPQINFNKSESLNGSIKQTGTSKMMLNQPSVDEFAQIEVGQRNREAGTLGQNDDWDDGVAQINFTKNIEDEEPKIPEAQPMGVQNFS